MFRSHSTRRMVFGLIVITAATLGAAEIPFGSRVLLETDYLYPTSITTGDLDGDGWDDVVAAAFDGSEILWWQSLGNGFFQARTIASSVTDIDSVEIADINGDGHPDVVVTSAGTTDAVGWFENDGTPDDGPWSLRLIATSFNGAFHTAVGDYDGDGTLDVAAMAFDADTVSVALNTNGTGIGWSYETVDAAFDGAYWMTCGDFDRDGDPDVAAAALNSGEVSWWSRNAGSGTWTEHSIAVLSGDATFCEAADIDGDGDLDIFGIGDDGTAGADDVVRWWENDGSGGGWTEHTIGTPGGAVYAAHPADVDLDGDVDLLYAANTGDEIAWYENTAGDGLSWTSRAIDGTYAGGLEIGSGDFDGDGDPDVTAAYLSNNIAAWENLSIHRSATFPASTSVVDTTNGVRDLDAVDLDLDGDLDLLATELGAERVSWLENTAGDGSSWTLQTIKTAFAALAVDAGDIDGDGLIDVIGAADAGLLWWKSNGAGGWAENTIPATQTSKDAVALSDLDGDGDLDVVLGSNSDGVDWFENNGSGGSWTEGDVCGGWIWDADSLVVADIDGDGDPDVAVSSWDSVFWVPNELADSGGFGSEIDVVSGLDNARSIDAGDIDGDGDIDLAGLSEGDGTVLWWANTSGDGSTWSTTTTIVGGVIDPARVRLADLDLDGDLDLALAASGRSTPDDLIAWYENTAGDGSAWTGHTVAENVIRSIVVAVADLDGDGDPELAADSLGSAEMGLWWSNRGGQGAFETAATTPAGTIEPMTAEDVLKISAFHRGRPGDGDAEIASIALRLSDGDGTPLTDAQADALLYRLLVFEDDDDSGDFDSASDSEIAEVSTFALTDGILTIPMPDGDDKVRLTPTSSRVLFVVPVFEDDAAHQSPGQLEITHVAGTSSIEDRDHDLALRLEWAPEISSGVVAPTDPDLLFADDFESGDTTAWSE